MLDGRAISAAIHNNYSGEVLDEKKYSEAMAIEGVELVDRTRSFNRANLDWVLVRNIVTGELFSFYVEPGVNQYVSTQS